ncbi:hypothetical protein N7468_002398 [Penicillium chermesinum]|uniref:MHD domain-containing protein n=1 Tax=Penicillium chermesinum TaxID=63820 RepID=A0A9W9PIF7_9EURO|nr:uncharacterized protein N7468_002398 [Penicillium chermesinum]KAJ5247415.1 hypothetical protein N7468_002398 [Penicillium chermesinum]KAJ6145654.1 hypothetical protein N7470_009549 [Penicillium chermesinum]
MDLTRQEYPALLATLQPTQASAVLNDRVRVINKTHTDIADFLQERRRVEEAYAQGLRRLASRPQLDNGAALGIFQIPWQRIINATEALATSHETLANKIEEDVERPLRDYSDNNRDMQSMPGIQNNLSSLAKNLETAQKKVEKARDKSAKNPRQLTVAINAVEEVTQQWESRAPFVFEQLQAADEGRLNHLRDVLTQWQTHEVDQVERSRQAAESCLNVLLQVETADEIQTFAAKMKGNRVPTTPAPVRRQTSQLDTPTAAPAAPAASAFEAPDNTPPLPPPPRIQDDAASQRSFGSERPAPDRATSTPTPTHPEPPAKSTPLGGLRRLGTVMGRRKSMVVSPGASFDKKADKKRSPFAPFKRSDSSREMQIPESPPSTADGPVTSFMNDEPMRNSSVSQDHDPDAITHAPVTSSTPAAPATNGASPDIHARVTSNGTGQAQIDSDGFAERPSTIDEITRAQREAASLDDSGMNLTIRDKPILEDESQAKQAMDDMANALRLQAQSNVGIRRTGGTVRGRRDVRNTVYIPNPSPDMISSQAPPSDVQLPSSPIKHTPSLSTATDDHATSDTTSVRSGHTIHGHGPSIHPELHEPGLNASIVETVNAWFSDGNISKSVVMGELALAHNPIPGASAEPARIRLDNFPVLEKIAANPQFVHEVTREATDEKRGEYDLQLASISRPLPTVAFKYQVHLDPANPSTYCPVIFKPVWNIQDSQASAIIFYSINPAFVSHPAGSLVLKNVVLTVGLDISPEDETTKALRENVAHASSAVMYPNTGATFRRKNSTVTWRLPELEVKAPDTGEEGKFLVRFATSSPGPRKGKVEAKFELHSAGSADRLGVSQAVADAPANDPFSDEGSPHDPSAVSWQEVPTTRKLVGGKYVSA